MALVYERRSRIRALSANDRVQGGRAHETSMGHTVRLGGEEREFIAIRVLGRGWPDSDCVFDCNWRHTEVTIAAVAFHGETSGLTRAGEFVTFLQELIQLNDTLEGKAEFATLEGWLTIKITGDGKGHTPAEIELKEEVSQGNMLSCRLDVDQTFLREMVAGLRDVVEQFPEIEERAWQPE